MRLVLSTIALLALAVAAGGCVESYTPIDPQQISQPDQLPLGPGLLSGKDGQFTVVVGADKKE